MRESRIFNGKVEKSNFQSWFKDLNIGDTVSIIVKNGFLCANEKINPIQVLKVIGITPAGNIKLSDGTIWNENGQPLRKIRGLLNKTTNRHTHLSDRFNHLMSMSTLSVEEYNRLGEKIFES